MDHKREGHSFPWRSEILPGRAQGGSGGVDGGRSTPRVVMAKAWWLRVIAVSSRNSQELVWLDCRPVTQKTLCSSTESGLVTPRCHQNRPPLHSVTSHSEEPGCSIELQGIPVLSQWVRGRQDGRTTRQVQTCGGRGGDGRPQAALLNMPSK